MRALKIFDMHTNLYLGARVYEFHEIIGVTADNGLEFGIESALHWSLIKPAHYWFIE